ncbi:MAG TPA: DUF1203 domain-containing protein [Kofleriaceae bacterium]|nr:DUF1203 domain-containing protein [Kofleriaceae bacterium]
MAFQILGLPATPFQPLFALDDAALVAHRAVRRIADASPGYPCRVSLRDAAPGETVVLVHYEHHVVESPFRASHAIYVREHAEPAELAAGEVPVMLRSRLLSLRAFDAAGMLVAADVVDGRELEPALERLLRAAAYVHIHFAKPGCYAARAITA